MKCTPTRDIPLWPEEREEQERRSRELVERHVLPDRPTADDYERRRHEDLQALTDQQVWAERHVLTQELARRVYFRVREQWLWSSGQDHVTDREWLKDRIDRLIAEEQRRRSARSGRAA